MDKPSRKPNRLRQFDYSQTGAYFITICTKKHKQIFWNTVGASIARPEAIDLSESGKIVESAIQSIPQKYPMISVDAYAVMPNHVHLLLQIRSDTDGRPMAAPTISTVVQQMKGYVSKKIGKSPWQKLFHDHVIRNETDYGKIWEYIRDNPYKWKEDCFYEEGI